MTLDRKLIIKEIGDYVGITLGLLLYTVGYVFFLMPYEIVTGGVSGIGAIVFYVTRIPISYTYFLINGLLLIVGLKILGWKFLTKTIYAILMLTVLFGLAQSIIPKDEAGNFVKIIGGSQDFMSLVIGCMMTGTALAIVFLNNGSTGGTDIIAASVNKFHNVSLGTVLTFVDLIVIGSCLFIPQFGELIERIHKIVFGFCTMLIENFMLDYIMNRRRQSVQFFIFSNKWQEIANALGTKTDHGVTILDGHGWYTGSERKVICLLARKSESTYIFRLIKNTDPNAFVSQSAVIGVYGEGFDEMKVKADPPPAPPYKGGEQKTHPQPLPVKEGSNYRQPGNTAKEVTPPLPHREGLGKGLLVFATNNAHKLTEIRAILGNSIEVLSLNDIGCHDDIPETGTTLQENALQKATYIFDRYHIDCFADDTGLEVEALGGAPGIYSARYASLDHPEVGDSHDSEANMAKLLRELGENNNRRARFRTVIALKEKDHDGVTYFEGIVNGEITRERSGVGGFGYDPVFRPDGYSQTFAEMDADEKNAISHRGRATCQLADYLLRLNNKD